MAVDLTTGSGTRRAVDELRRPVASNAIVEHQNAPFPCVLHGAFCRVVEPGRSSSSTARRGSGAVR